jgi:hypothetical protein
MAWQTQPLQVAEYTPDMPDYNNPGSSNILNAIPRTPQSYGPMASLIPFGAAIDARCQGAFSCADALGNNYIFAGNATKLYKYTSASLTPSDISKTGGYSTSANQQWKFQLFGQRVIATNFVNAVQSFLINTSTTFSDLSVNAPKAQHVGVAKSFLILANTYDPISGNQPQRVWWSGLNDPTNWPTPGTSLAAQYQSSYNDLLGDGGKITGVIGDLGGCDIAIFMERRVWRGVYAGPPIVFDFFPAESVRGTNMPNSIVQVGKDVYYPGEDGFYVFDGSSSQPIGANKVDKTFYAMLDQNYLERVVGAADPINKIVYWLFPSISATGGMPDTMIAYNWSIGRWSLCAINAETIFRSLSFGFTLDTMPGPLDSLTIPLDSSAWTGGNGVLSGFDINHKLSYFNGPNLQATLETSESAPFEEQLAYIKNTRPLIDGGNPVVSVATRNRLIDTSTYGSDALINRIGTNPLIANGRYIKAKVVMAAGDTWKHFQGINIDAEPNGDQ